MTFGLRLHEIGGGSKILAVPRTRSIAFWVYIGVPLFWEATIYALRGPASTGFIQGL